MGKVAAYTRCLVAVISAGILTACLDFTGPCNHPPTTLETYEFLLHRDAPSDTIRVGETLWLRGVMPIPNIQHLQIVEKKLPYAPGFSFRVYELQDTVPNPVFHDADRPFILQGERGTSRYYGRFPAFDGLMTADELVFAFGFQATVAGVFKLTPRDTYAHSGNVLVDEIHDDCPGKLVFVPQFPIQNNTELLNAYPNLAMPKANIEYVIVVVE